jgi:hypothetical protein
VNTSPLVLQTGLLAMHLSSAVSLDLRPYSLPLPCHVSFSEPFGPMAKTYRPVTFPRRRNRITRNFCRRNQGSYAHNPSGCQNRLLQVLYMHKAYETTLIYYHRIVIFYLLTCIVIGLNGKSAPSDERYAKQRPLVPYTYPNLSNKTTTTSPFTIVFTLAGSGNKATCVHSRSHYS